MEVIAFVGPSGSGKSHRAQAVAHDYQAELIIDDGLLIKGSRILAGVSAKEQPTRIGAIKTALFTDPRHAAEVKAQIQAHAPERLLILSTSRQMAAHIATRLDLPPPAVYIHISEVASPREIARAREIRKHWGKHVIPVPTAEVKSRFRINFIEPLKTFFRRHSGPGRPKTLWVEQTVVRPTFSLLGRLYISEKAIEQIASYVARDPVMGLLRALVQESPAGLTINLEVRAPYATPWRPHLQALQLKVKQGVEELTGLTVGAVNITVRQVAFPTSYA